MTTYSHKLTLSDGEIIVLEEALKMMIKRCESEITKGGAAPYHSWLYSAREIKRRLYSQSEMMSANSFYREQQ